MKDITVTKALRDSVKKITKRSNMLEQIFSDTRDNKIAVGVKICNRYNGFEPSIQSIKHIINDMESKGFEFKYIKRNEDSRYYSGIRFCFYKLQYSNIK
jgi:hypothetical protein